MILLNSIAFLHMLIRSNDDFRTVFMLVFPLFPDFQSESVVFTEDFSFLPFLASIGGFFSLSFQAKLLLPKLNNITSDFPQFSCSI